MIAQLWESIVICPRCQVPFTRRAVADAPPVCRHWYHEPEDCDVCGPCRYRWEGE